MRVRTFVVSNLFNLTPDKIYDPALNAYIDLNVTSATVTLATPVKSGLMSKEDFTKLNKLYFPSPTSTISSEDCRTEDGRELRFKRGILRFYGSEFVKVEDTAALKNINYQGDILSELTPYQIHTHTNGININVDTDKLIRYLEDNKRIIIQGKKGAKGASGAQGDRGADRVLSGPQGDKGDDGIARPCTLSVEPEILENRPISGLSQAIVGAYVKTDPVNPKKYSLVFERQSVGRQDLTADKLNVKGSSSNWILFTPQTAGVSDIFFLDIEPILNEMESQYNKRALNLKAEYEEKVQTWVQAMSDLFDQQKAAICCALQYCRSAQINIDTRRHIESLAATALPDATLSFCPKTSPDAEFINIQDSCADMDTDKPECFKRPDIMCEVQGQAQAQKLNDEVVVSAFSNIDSISAATLDLPAGRYILTIKETDSYIDGQYSVKIKIKYADKTLRLMDKGDYRDLRDSREAYIGLTTEIDHKGGIIHFWTNTIGSQLNSGSTVLSVTSVDEIYKLKSQAYRISRNKLIEIFNDYSDSKSFIIRLNGQDYIAISLEAKHGQIYNDLTVKGIVPTIAVPLVNELPIVDYNNFYINEDATDRINNALKMNDCLQVGREEVKSISTCLLPSNEN